MPLKVIGAGLGRTGTMSLKVALENLGFDKCYHMVEVLAHPELVPVDWEALVRGYQATVDWPSCNFSAEFLRRYPEAKVILTVRDPDSWSVSVWQTSSFARDAFPPWATPFIPRMRRNFRMVNRLIWDGMFRGQFEEKSYAIEVFHRHNEEVQRVVPPERLLVYEVKEGWGPLCAVLGVPVPEGKPFPHRNDAEEFRPRV